MKVQLDGTDVYGKLWIIWKKENWYQGNIL